MVRIAVLLFTVNYLISSVIPNEYFLIREETLNKSGVPHPGLASNGIVDIGSVSPDQVYYGTGAGLGMSIQSAGDPVFSHFTREEFPGLPRGASPALYVDESVIVIAGVMDTIADGSGMSMGTGVSVSMDNGETWEHYPQPVDENPDDPETEDREIYFYTDWYGISVRQLAVTTEINNVTYELTVSGDYLYSASWAGGIRRHKFRNIMPGENNWEILPLPADYAQTMYCGFNPPSGYTIDPRDPNPADPANSGHHNHKGFSVYAQGDSILWAGTANGINKGIIDQNNCISWEHYTTGIDGLSGNWVIGFEHQSEDVFGNEMDRIWAITWSTGGSESNGVSFSDDGGFTWEVPAMITDMGLKVYNIYSSLGQVFLCSDRGLFMSENGYYWEKLSRPVEYSEGAIVEEIKSESVYSVYSDGMMLWLGTNDGLGRTFDLGLSWEVFRFWAEPDYTNDQNAFYAYPNPFFISQVNRVGNDGFVRFAFPYAGEGKIHIFDFNMKEIAVLDEFHNIDSSGEVFWNGRSRFGNTVANGVYFCRLETNNKNYWTKLAILN